MEKEWYEEEVQPYRKTDYKPILIIFVSSFLKLNTDKDFAVNSRKKNFKNEKSDN